MAYDRVLGVDIDIIDRANLCHNNQSWGMPPPEMGPTLHPGTGHCTTMPPSLSLARLTLVSSDHIRPTQRQVNVPRMRTSHNGSSGLHRTERAGGRVRCRQGAGNSQYWAISGGDNTTLEWGYQLLPRQWPCDYPDTLWPRLWVVITTWIDILIILESDNLSDNWHKSGLEWGLSGCSDTEYWDKQLSAAELHQWASICHTD